MLAAGQAVGDWAPGDAVMTHPVPLRDQGTWAPRLIAPAGLLARKPPSASWEAAATFPVPALTAEQVLGDALNIHAGEQLLVHGAGGVTGGLLVALASLRGAQVIATAGHASQQRVRRSGRASHRLPRPRMARTGPRDNRTPRSGRRGQRGTRRCRQRDPGGRRRRASGDHHLDRPASSAASRSPASTSAQTETSCANSRSNSETVSWRFRSPPATASPMPPRHSPRQPAATPPEPSSSHPDQPREGPGIPSRRYARCLRLGAAIRSPAPKGHFNLTMRLYAPMVSPNRQMEPSTDHECGGTCCSPRNPIKRHMSNRHSATSSALDLLLP